MPYNLAGYDVIFELSRFSLQQVIYSAPFETSPSGAVLQTFTPPFQVAQTVPLSAGSVAINFIVDEVSLIGQIGTPNVTIELDFSKSSVQGLGNVISMLSGSFTVQGSLTATTPNDPKFDPGKTNTSFLGANFQNPVVVVTFDSASMQQMRSTLGSTTTNELITLLQAGVTQMFAAKGIVASTFGFKIVSGTDSTSPNQLTAVPDISWIDSETLGIFGYFQQNGAGGNPTSKLFGDRDRFDPLSAAVLMSADGFHRVVARQTVLNMAIDQVSGNVMPGYIAKEQANDGGSGTPTPKELAAAQNDFTNYLATTTGQDAVDASLPGPWGSGNLDSPLKMPVPFADTTEETFWLDINLGDEVLVASIKTRATASTIGIPAAHIEVDQSPTISLIIDDYGNIVPTFHSDTNPHVSTTPDTGLEIAVAFLTTYLTGPLWGILGTVVAISIAEAIANSFISNMVATQTETLGSLSTATVKGVIWNSINVSSDALLLGGDAAWLGATQGAYFVPGASLNAVQQPRTQSNTPSPVAGIYQYPGTDFGCPAQDFAFTERWFDTTWQLSVQVQDMALPITVGPWYVTLGHASGSDPLPTWTGTGASLAEPFVTLSGPTALQMPPPTGQVVMQSEIQVTATGDDQQGWTLTGRGQDGRYFLLVETEVTDASQTTYPIQQTIFFFGEEIDYAEYGLLYEAAMEACAKRAAKRLETLVPMAPLVFSWPWTWGETIGESQAGIIGQVIVGQLGGALAALASQITVYGQEYANTVVQAYVAMRTTTKVTPPRAVRLASQPVERAAVAANPKRRVRRGLLTLVSRWITSCQGVF